MNSECRRLEVPNREMNELGTEGWKLIDVRHHRSEPSWVDELLFMRKIRDPEGQSTE